MKTLTATLLGPIRTDYSFNTMKFGFCSAPVDRHVKQVTGWETCRENMMRILRNRMVRTGGKVDIRRTRLLTYVRATIPGHSWSQERKEKHAASQSKKINNQMQASLRLMNHFERRVGWPLTRMHKVDQERNPLAHIHMVTGSSRWQKSTHYFSLYLLMIRLGRSNFSAKFKDHEELLEKLETFARRTTNDSAFVRKTYQKWDIFLQNQDKLFSGRKLKGIFSKKALVNEYDGFSEGIRQLCTGWSRDLTLAHRFKELCDKEGIEQLEKVMESKKEQERRRANIRSRSRTRG